MPTLTEGSRAMTGPLALNVDSDNGEVERQSPPRLLIDVMELVEPRKPMHVPNHLLETKTYSKMGQNCMVHVKPETVHFDGFEVNEKHVKKLVILNASADVLRLHLIPPQSKYFSINYKKRDRMVPGLTLECTVEFHPDEWRYYYDCIRINCPGDENLIVPIHGYPIMSTKEFPRNFTFPETPVGHKCSRIFPLRCMVPVDFEFELTFISSHPAFSIQPLSGIVPANSETEVTVTFAPYEFQTACMTVQLNISQFNAKPIICKFIGTSRPGLEREKTLTKLLTNHAEVLDPRCISPLDRIRRKYKLIIKEKRKPQPPPAMSIQKIIEYKGLEFPSALDTPYAVAKVLNQVPGKLRAKDLRNNVLTKQDTITEAVGRQLKEARFEYALRQNVHEERQNQLCWQVRLGDEQISSTQRGLILDARAQAEHYYKYSKREDPVPEDEYRRQKTKISFCRTLRDKSKLGAEGMKFDPYMNNIWATRNSALDRFVQAIRKVIVRRRAVFKLKSLRRIILNWGDRKLSVHEDEKENPDSSKGQEQNEIESRCDLQLSAQHIQRTHFPTYVPPNAKDDMAADALGEVPLVATQVVIKRKVPYFNLKVPQMYQLQGYQSHSIHLASSGYVPDRLARPLRTGAQDEVIVLPQVPISISERAVTSCEAGFIDEIQSVGDVLKDTQKGQKGSLQLPVISTLSPPEALFKPIDYPALHIMVGITCIRQPFLLALEAENPAPGLQVFQAPMPYSEIDHDFHLCPLPRYFCQDYASNPHTSTQRRYLDREDTIRGVMSWKKFPSQGLTSLANTPTLTNVWVPRWDDNFSTDLLPTTVPAVLDKLPVDEAQTLAEESRWIEESERINLTPDMVNAEFQIDTSVPDDDSKPASDAFPYGNKMPSTNISVGPDGPVAREKREDELEYFMTKKYNRLGSKFQSKISSLNALLSQPHLQLN